MHFDPTSFLRREDQRITRQSTNLIILNQPIKSAVILETLWQHSGFKICADGGANRLYDVKEQSANELIPDLIHGDLDSLKDEVKSYYEKKGVKVTRDGDQYSTDFNKAIKRIRERSDKGGQSITDILVIGSISGRVDQGIGLLHEFYRETLNSPQCRLWLFSECSISFILPIGRNDVTTNLSEGILTRNIGILPIFKPARITTQGLEWDVSDWETAMGGQMSTSNHVMADEVIVETNEPVLFTIEMKEEFITGRT